MKLDIIKKKARAFVQLLFFFIAPALFSAAFGAVKSIASLIGKGEALEITSAVITLLLLLIFTWLFGRVFCGMVCSFGAFGDFLFFLGETARHKLKKKRLILSPKLEKALSYLKYIVLLAFIILCFLQRQFFIHGKSPWEAFAQLISGAPAWKGYEIGYVILFILMLGMISIPRFFCRFFCPLGAIFSLLPPPFLSLRKPSGESTTHRACGRCRVCMNACPAGLPLNDPEKPMDIVSSGECFRCMKCAQVCPQKKPALFLFGKRLALMPVMAIILLLFLAALLFFGLTRF